MNEYPIFFYFFVFALLVFFNPNVGLFLFTLLFFLFGLYADKVFVLFLKRHEWKEYDKVFILPFGNSAYAIGNSILISRSLLLKDYSEAILYHELAHIKFRDWTSVFLLLVFYRIMAEFLESKEFVVFSSLYSLMFFWFYWHMEVRSDLYAKLHGKDIESALEEHKLSWRLRFIKGQDSSLQENAIAFTITFLSALYLLWLYLKEF